MTVRSVLMSALIVIVRINSRGDCVQGLSRELRLSEGWQESKLRLHQLRLLWVGVLGSFPADDAGLLGESFPAGQ